MTLVGLIILLVFVGIALALIPMDQTIKRIIIIIVIVLFLIWLLGALGINTGIHLTR